MHPYKYVSEEYGVTGIPWGQMDTQWPILCKLANSNKSQTDILLAKKKLPIPTNFSLWAQSVNKMVIFYFISYKMFVLYYINI